MSKTTNEQDLIITLADMNSLASASLRRIEGVAKCALRSMETAGGVSDLEAIAQVLETIIHDASLTNMELDCEAEENCLETLSKERERRFCAMNAIELKNEF